MKQPSLLFTALWTALLLASTVYAADIRLSSRCTLADAIIAANYDRPEGGCPAGRVVDTIILTQDITLQAELPVITSDIIIEGNGYAISGDNRWRIFYNDGGALTINDLTMTKGYVEAELIRNEDGTLKASTANSIGGAIYNANGTVSISDSVFSHNSTKYFGGAIYTDGTLTISDSSFSSNSSADWGGAIYNGGEGTLTIGNSDFSGNSAIGDEDDPDSIGSGGAVSNRGELSIRDSTFSGNSADWGGAIINWDEELNITNSTFSGNSAGSGGAINNVEDGELSISDSSFSGNSAGSGGAINNGGDLTIGSSSFSGNSADGAGGAVYNAGYGELSISDSSFSGSSADSGGVINNGGELSIISSAFSDNLAVDGGVINNWGELSISDSGFSDNSAVDGGAITNWEGTLSINNSAFSGNSAERAGGAIVNWVETLSISNSAFSGNSAERAGGAIGNEGELSIVNSAFSGNSAKGFGGAISNGRELSIINSIIAGSGGACYSSSGLTQNIGNFIQDGSCDPAFRGDPKLGELVEPEDGSPAYLPLLAGSRAIDAADSAYCPATDQIGTARPQGAGCDIGAIEYAAP